MLTSPRLLREAIAGLGKAPSSISELPASLLLASEGPIDVFYAPLDDVNRRARIAIVGITPGWAQTKIALIEAQRVYLEGGGTRKACRAARRAAHFAGPMRKNLVSMLDAVGLHQALGVTGAATLFGDAHALLHTTSAIRYPVFVGGRNYTGYSPSAERSPLLRSIMSEVLAPELESLPEALIVPLGRAAESCVNFVVESEGLKLSILKGFPHPSGANGHRVRQLAENRGSLRRQVRLWAARTR